MAIMPKLLLKEFKMKYTEQIGQRQNVFDVATPAAARKAGLDTLARKAMGVLKWTESVPKYSYEDGPCVGIIRPSKNGRAEVMSCQSDMNLVSHNILELGFLELERLGKRDARPANCQIGPVESYLMALGENASWNSDALGYVKWKGGQKVELFPQLFVGFFRPTPKGELELITAVSHSDMLAEHLLHFGKVAQSYMTGNEVPDEDGNVHFYSPEYREAAE